MASNIFIPFIPKEELAEYLADPNNQTIWKNCGEQADLDFFKLIHRELVIILNCKYIPDEILEHFEWVDGPPWEEDVQKYDNSPQFFWQSLFFLLLSKIGKPRASDFDAQLAVMYKSLHNKYGHLAAHGYLAPEIICVKRLENLDDYLHNDFNVAIYYDIQERFGHSYEPLQFLNRLYEAIEIAKALICKPAAAYKLLTAPKGEDSPNTNALHSECLVFWLLVAVKNRIGFKEWCNEEAGRENKVKVLYNFLDKAYHQNYSYSGYNNKHPYYDFNSEGFRGDDDSAEQTPSDLQSVSDKNAPVQKFKLSSKRGAKIDLIRILNALYELGYIETSEGYIPTKADFMMQAGMFFGADLAKYHADLSQAGRSSLEVNLKVFEEMKRFTQNSHFEGDK